MVTPSSARRPGRHHHAARSPRCGGAASSPRPTTPKLSGRQGCVAWRHGGERRPPHPRPSPARSGWLSVASGHQGARPGPPGKGRGRGCAGQDDDDGREKRRTLALPFIVYLFLLSAPPRPTPPESTGGDDYIRRRPDATPHCRSHGYTPSLRSPFRESRESQNKLAWRAQSAIFRAPLVSITTCAPPLQGGGERTGRAGRQTDRPACRMQPGGLRAHVLLSAYNPFKSNPNPMTRWLQS